MGCKDDMARTEKSRPRTKSDARTKWQGRKKVVLGRRDEITRTKSAQGRKRLAQGRNKNRPGSGKIGPGLDFKDDISLGICL